MLDNIKNKNQKNDRIYHFNFLLNEFQTRVK